MPTEPVTTTAKLLATLEQMAPLLDSGAFKTIILLAAVLVLRWLAIRAVHRVEFATPEARRRWLVAVRNLVLPLFAIGAVVIWAEELESLVLSVVAIAAALVIATKELIMCASGALLRTSTQAFHVGDRIELNGFRGDVIDHNFLATTLLEVGPGATSHQLTGRAVVLPNSLLLQQPLINETLHDDYVLHQFIVAIARDEDWAAAERALLQSAETECAPFFDVAKEHLHQQAAKFSLELMNVEPRVYIRLGDPHKIELVVRVPAPARRRGRTEQAILRRYLERVRGAPRSQRAQEPTA